MTGGDDSSSRVIERYRSKALNKDSQVSVSGLDISKDKRELLVSYENDQIYTFPIFPHVSSAAGPSVEDIQAQTICEGDNEDKVVTELCSFGAHLNRYTFLKVSFTSQSALSIWIHSAYKCVKLLERQIRWATGRLHLYWIGFWTCMDL